MLLSLKNAKTNKQQQNKQKQTTSLCLHHRWRYYQAIALNGQQVGPTSLALLSP